MPDFRDQLGRELRHAGERRWSERTRAFSAGAVAAMAGAAVAIAIAVAVVLSLRPPSSTEQTGSPGPGENMVLQPAIPARGCSTARMLAATSTPRSLSSMLGVLRRPQREPDGLPVLNAPGGGAGDEGWLPAASIALRGVRLVQQRPNIWIVPSRALATADDAGFSSPCPSSRVEPSHAGACLVTGIAGGPLSLGCFTTKDIEEGRAAMFVGSPDGNGGEGIVLAPDGVRDVEVIARDVHGAGGAVNNVALMPLRGARAGERVRVVFVPQARRVGRAPDGVPVWSSLGVRGRTCPGDALPLRRGDRAAIAAAALQVIAKLVPRGRPPIDTRGAVARGHSAGGGDGAPVQAMCGRLARERSVVVDARFPQVRFSAALSHAVYYVSREPRGWLVWGIGPG